MLEMQEMLGRSLGGGHGNPLQYSCLENPMDRGAQWATVHGVAKNWTGLKWPSTARNSTVLSTNIISVSRSNSGSPIAFSYVSFLQSGQSLSHVWLFATPWTAAHQASLSITNSRSLLKLMSIEAVMPSSHLPSVVPFSSCPQSLPASGSFPMSQLFAWGGQSIGVSASVSVLPMDTQDWSPSGWTGWISLQPKGLSRVFSNTTVQKHQFFGAQLSSQSNSHIHTWPLEKP